MTKLIIIRHAAKQYESSSGHYDSPIIETEWTRGKLLLINYIKKYNIFPDKILCSPYLRTRETASILSEITQVCVNIDQRFSNYLSRNKKYEAKNFFQETFDLNPIKPERVHEFRYRIKKSFEEILNDSKDEYIWIVTHGYVISTYLKLLSSDRIHSFAPLEGVIIEDGIITKL